jgi:hypothetical protein
MADSWRPPITEVHGLASHGQAVRSLWFSVLSLANLYPIDLEDLRWRDGRKAETESGKHQVVSKLKLRNQD